jgi:hypothetical protein
LPWPDSTAILFRINRKIDVNRARFSAMQTKNLTLVPHAPQQLLILIKNSGSYQKCVGMRVADGVREFLLAASPEFLAELRLSTAPDPWKFGFAIVHTQENVLIGLCGFTGPVNPDGAVEIAYSIAPSYQGRVTPRKPRLRLLITRSTATESKPSALTRSQSLMRQHASSKNAAS